ncbi:uncharacterized protein LOC117829676 [Notolabrus celidotus]|uniref:uncharacterized protein LOC117829676 n=1 Tax=Notolabrus celidotus TaxID=1203425 RepID=UPI00148F8682|nr:uncharacterized protein LOC117829676 [Notolabrus celidotus]
MSNQSLVLFPTVSSTTPLFSNGSTSTDSTLTGQLDLIAANDITSRANYLYSLFAALGFIAGCFLLYSFIQTYRAQRRLAWLDCLLWAFCGFQLLLLLLSLHIVTRRPAYLHTTVLGCAALSFIINAVFLCGLLVLVLMAYVLTLDPPSHALLRKPAVCVALVILTSVVLAVLVAGARGTFDDLHKVDVCVMDPASSGVSYAVARLCLVFLIPYTLQLGLLIGGCVRQWKSKGRFLSGSEEGPMFLTVTLVMFFCQLFYSVVLLRGAQLHRDRLSHHEEAFLSVAEFVLFSGSSFSLLLVLFMHRPCRDSLHGVYRQLRDCCRSSGRTQSNRNIIAPHIEITDTLQDIES